MPIIKSSDHYGYVGTVLTIDGSPELKEICDKGIFYPDIIKTAFPFTPKIDIRLKDSIAAWEKRNPVTEKQKVSFGIPENDSIRISNFGELTFLNTSPKQKKFRFWLYRKGFANPIVYFMELTNQKATSETDISSFIDGATLTFFEEGWVII